MPAQADAGKPRTWMTLAKEAFTQFFEDKVPRMAAALAYYTAFALAPMLVIAVFIVRIFISNSAEARNNVISAMGQVIGGMSPDQANQILQAADKQGQASLQPSSVSSSRSSAPRACSASFRIRSIPSGT